MSNTYQYDACPLPGGVRIERTRRSASSASGANRPSTTPRQCYIYWGVGTRGIQGREE